MNVEKVLGHVKEALDRYEKADKGVFDCRVTGLAWAMANDLRSALAACEPKAEELVWVEVINDVWEASGYRIVKQWLSGNFMVVCAPYGQDFHALSFASLKEAQAACQAHADSQRPKTAIDRVRGRLATLPKASFPGFTDWFFNAAEVNLILDEEAGK